MRGKEKQVIEKLKQAIPRMSDFDKGYILGKIEGLTDNKPEDKEEKDVR